MKYEISPKDREYLRQTAEKYMDAATSERNIENIARFYAMDSGVGQDRPAILVEAIMDDERRARDMNCRCEGEFARGIEDKLLYKMSDFYSVFDDNPLDPYLDIGIALSSTDYGIAESKTLPEDWQSPNSGAYHIDPVIKDIETDFPKLKHREFSLNFEDAEQRLEATNLVFGDILPSRMRGYYYWTMGLTNTVINFIGLEELMIYMYEEPEGLHKIMSFFCDDFMNMVSFLEDNKFYTLNNEGDYTGSGSRGYTKRLPSSTDGVVRAKDLWCLVESQETVGVSPEGYGEFIYPYEKKLAERFGSVYYGCCEPVHTRWEILKNMPNLKRISVSPWCDEKFMAKECAKTGIGYSRKPNPTLVSTTIFDEETIKDDIRYTAELIKTYGCNAEIVMKDVHTLNGEHDRLDRWAKLTKNVIENIF